MTPLVLVLGGEWSTFPDDGRDVTLRFDDGEVFEATVRRCANGRLQDSYPVGAHDVEICAPSSAGHPRLAQHLGALCRAVLAADPHCRRVVFAADAGDPVTAAAARSAGYRYVLDVDIPGAQLSLFVAERD